MKQYLSPEQTAKLIELGFEKPKNERWVLDIANESTPSIQNIVKRQDYSIGELIEMLPKTIEHEIWWGDEKGEKGYWGLRIDTDCTEYMWTITYQRNHYAPLDIVGAGEELIDALYEMAIKLKEEGVICGKQ